MARYQVKLLKTARINGKRTESGSVVEIDEKVYAQLSYHKAIEVISESSDHANAIDAVVVNPSNENVNTVDADAIIPSNETQLVEKLTELPDYKRIKTDEIKVQLALYNVAFETNDKSELYELLKAAIESGE